MRRRLPSIVLLVKVQADVDMNLDCHLKSVVAEQLIARGSGRGALLLVLLLLSLSPSLLDIQRRQHLRSCTDDRGLAGAPAKRRKHLCRLRLLLSCLAPQRRRRKAME
jgi:hypothetical protein